MQNGTSNLFEIFDTLSEPVCVSDVETHELLYANSSAARAIPGLWRGRPCHDVLRGLSEPCGFCDTDEFSRGGFIACERFGERLGKHYASKEKVIDWEGRPVRFEIAFDTTEDVEQKTVLENQLGLETLLVDCIMEFRRSSGFEGDPLPAFAKIARFFKADRVYVIEVDDRGSMRSTFEWCAEGVSPQIEKLQDIPLSHIARWMPYFERRDCVIVDGTEAACDESPGEHDVFGSRGITRLVAAPVYVNEKLFGYIGVDNPEGEHLDLSASFFKTVGMFLSMEVEQAAIREKLRRMSFEDSLTGVWNRNRFIEDVQQLDAQGPRAGFGVMYIDLNGLKSINDCEGHAVGDQALVDAARILDAAFTKSDVYRLGGDEFAVLSFSKDKDLFERRVTESSRKLGSRLCSAAVGIHFAEVPCTVDEAVRLADGRMYQDKRRFYGTDSAMSRHQSMYGASDATQ